MTEKQRKKYNRSLIKVDDPYSFLALNVISQAFEDIRSYFFQEGLPEEIKEGSKSIGWITKMEGNFRLFAGVTKMPLEKFHQLCLAKINQIKREAYCERLRMAKKDRKGKIH